MQVHRVLYFEAEPILSRTPVQLTPKELAILAMLDGIRHNRRFVTAA